MALILNIETSTTICSVCLGKDGQLLDFREDQQGTSHARLLTVFIDELLKSNNLSPQQLDAVAVSSGPGSYTGLRIGTSVAKGLCYALNKPLIAVPTLLALAEGIKEVVKDESAFYMPVIDARRMDMYTALFDAQQKQVVETDCVTIDLTLEQKLATYGSIYIGGNAVNKCRQIFTSSNIHFTDNVQCNARSMLYLSESKYNLGKFENTAYFEPFYLKEFGKKS